MDPALDTYIVSQEAKVRDLSQQAQPAAVEILKVQGRAIWNLESNWSLVLHLYCVHPIMASVLYCLAYGFYFSDFPLGNNQKNEKKNVCIDAYTNIIANSPGLPFSRKKQNQTKPKNRKKRKQ